MPDTRPGLLDELLTRALVERGFSGPWEDNPVRDFMATYFDHDDDVTRGMVIDFLERIAALAGRSVTPDGDGRPVCGLCHNRHPRLMRNETCPVVGACDGVHYYVESRRICQTWASDCPDLRRC